MAWLFQAAQTRTHAHQARSECSSGWLTMKTLVKVFLQQYLWMPVNSRIITELQLHGCKQTQLTSLPTQAAAFCDRKRISASSNKWLHPDKPLHWCNSCMQVHTSMHAQFEFTVLK